EIPEKLIVDISELQIGQSIKAGDLKYPGIELLDSRKALVLSVATSRVAQKTDAAEEGAETAEAETPAE
ncbi:MAG: 50S ribosomal protein L25, partial [Bacteroidetes bacterium]|nr:50S ribosomal protein L25 [Bacteroidota bacterium]